MTAKVLSPPDLDESLRERLIREGKILPTGNVTSNELMEEEVIDENFYSMGELIDLKVLELLRANYLNRCTVHALRPILKISEILRSSRRCKYVSVYYLLALLRKYINIIVDILNSIEEKLSRVISIVRLCFFYSFKECMKNTP